MLSGRELGRRQSCYMSLCEGSRPDPEQYARAPSRKHRDAGLGGDPEPLWGCPLSMWGHDVCIRGEEVGVAVSHSLLGPHSPEVTEAWGNLGPPGWGYSEPPSVWRVSEVSKNDSTPVKSRPVRAPARASAPSALPGRPGDSAGWPPRTCLLPRPLR